MSQSPDMRDLYGYQAYLRLKRGWKMLSASLLGIALSPAILNVAMPEQIGQVLLVTSLALGAWGALLAASGSLGGLFRKICLFVGANFGILLACEGRSALPWLTLLLALWAGDRCLRQEMGLSKGALPIPPGCLVCLIFVPFFWPMAVFFGSAFLSLHLLFAYAYVSGALPRPEELAEQLHDPVEHALEALTRT